MPKKEGSEMVGKSKTNRSALISRVNVGPSHSSPLVNSVSGSAIIEKRNRSSKARRVTTEPSEAEFSESVCVPSISFSDMSQTFEEHFTFLYQDKGMYLDTIPPVVVWPVSPSAVFGSSIDPESETPNLNPQHHKKNPREEMDSGIGPMDILDLAVASNMRRKTGMKASSPKRTTRASVVSMQQSPQPFLSQAKRLANDEHSMSIVQSSPKRTTRVSAVSMQQSPQPLLSQLSMSTVQSSPKRTTRASVVSMQQSPQPFLSQSSTLGRSICTIPANTVLDPLLFTSLNVAGPEKRFSYFKPCLQVQQAPLKGHELPTLPANGVDDSRVDELHVRGWRVDDTAAEIFQQCIHRLGKLRVMRLWRVGLTSSALDVLSEFLPKCFELTVLSLDANPLQDMKVEELLKPGSRLTHLSLRFCQLDADNAARLARALGTSTHRNRTLMHLNLANNQIGDGGAESVAEALKTNRCLLELNLANNRIGDAGACALAAALSHFTFTFEQLLVHRKQLAEVCSWDARKSRSGDGKRSRESGRTSRQSQKNKEAKEVKSKIKKMGNDRTNKNSKDPKEPKEPKDLKIPTDQKDTKDQKDRKDGDKASPKIRSPSPPRSKTRRRSSDLSKGKVKTRQNSKDRDDDVDIELTNEVIGLHPFSETPRRGQEGGVLMLGNRCLASLNLSRNTVGEAGLSRLFDMVKTQPILWPRQKQRGQGLLRLVVHRNRIPRDDPRLLEMDRLLATRDPRHKVPLVRVDSNTLSSADLPRNLAF